jgi:3-hydroxyanthranilate 3,4-dioxygenase
MAITKPFNLQVWIEENRHLLKPPVGNKVIYKGNDDFIVMVVGGPNSRKDYHFNEGEELFYQYEGEITVKIIDEGKPLDITIKEGEMFLLPPRTPHSPRRPANSVGLVIERYRGEKEEDGFMWFCEKCGNHLYHEKFVLKDISTQLPKVMETFYNSLELRTCKKCAEIFEKPE